MFARGNNFVGDARYQFGEGIIDVHNGNKEYVAISVLQVYRRVGEQILLYRLGAILRQ
jgi:hypothetical protein